MSAITSMSFFLCIYSLYRSCVGIIPVCRNPVCRIPDCRVHSADSQFADYSKIVYFQEVPLGFVDHFNQFRTPTIICHIIQAVYGQKMENIHDIHILYREEEVLVGDSRLVSVCFDKSCAGLC